LRQQASLNPLLMSPKMTKYIPHRPLPKQAAFLLLPHIEAFYGGEPGGGKSDALLMGALQYVDVPGYAAILFRRTFQDLSLPGALMDRSKEWLTNTDAAWNEQRKTWTFPSGATVSFGYLESENDKFRYQSAEFQYIGFDELSQFSERQYRYLFSRLRRLAGSQIPLRMRSASNPPASAAGQWVKERFVLERNPKRPFIPSGLDDNPYLDRDEYLASLDELDTATRKSLFDWFASVEGLVFEEFNADNLTSEDVNGALPVMLAVDDGYFPDPRATLFVQSRGSDLLVFDELYQYRTLEEQTVEDIVNKCQEHGIRLPKQASVSHEAPALRRRLNDAKIPAYSWLKTQSADQSTRVAAIKLTRSLIKDAKGRRVIKIHHRCKNLIREITQGYRYPDGKHGADDRPEDGNDHACEALEGLVWMLYGGNRHTKPRVREY
jgi:hypothetical protein